MELIIFEGTGDGFMKIERSGQRWSVLVCGSNLPQAPLFWAVSAETLEVFPFVPHARRSYDCRPDACGIFAVEGGQARLLSGGGNLQQLKQDFEAVLPALPTVSAEEKPAREAAVSSPAAEPVQEAAASSPAAEPVQEEPLSVSVLSAAVADFADEPEDTLHASNAFFFGSCAAPESYYDCNRERLEKLLEEGKPVSALDDLIPGSRWVQGTGDEFVTGIIFDSERQPLYVCYGIPAPWTPEPPEAVAGYGQWIPSDCALPRGKGYWVVYQSALTGEKMTV